MPASVQHEYANVYRLDLSGLLAKTELEACERRLAEEMRNGRSVRLLVMLDRFEGWAPDKRWNDLSFYARHGDAIVRIAIVGDERWRSMAMMFASADLRRAPVEFFREQDAAAAREWLSVGG
jgi:hypothetical protein